MEMFGEDVKPQKLTKEVFVVVERPGHKAMWIRIGSAWTNRDGSMRVMLHATPKNGELVIRDPRPFEDTRRPSVAPAV